MTLPDYLIYITVAEYVGLFVGLIVWVYFTRVRPIHRALFYRVIRNSGVGDKMLIKVGQRNFKPDADFVRFGNEAYPIFFEKMAYRDGNKSVWSFELENKVGITYGGSHDTKSGDIVEGLLYKGVLRRFADSAKSLGTTLTILLVLMVVIAFLAFVAGLFSSPYILPAPVPVA